MKNRAFAYFLFITALSGIIGNITGFFLPMYFKEIGLTGWQIGVVFAVSSAANVLLSLPMGITSDRLRIVGILILSCLLGAVSKLGLIFSESFWVFCVFALIGSFGGRFYGIASTTLFFKMTGEDNAREAGRYQVVSFIAMAVGMMCGGFLINDFSYRTAFVVSALGGVAIALLCWFLPRNETVVVKIEEYKKAVTDPGVIFLTVVFFIFALHWGAEMVSYGPFLKETLGLTIPQTGLFTGGGFLFIALGAHIAFVGYRRGWIRDLQTMLIAGFFLSGTSHILMCVPDVGWSFFFRAVHEFGDGFYILAFYHGIPKIFHLDRIGGCSSFISLWQGVAALVGAVLYGALNDVAAPQWGLIISGIITLTLPVILAFRGRFGFGAETAVEGMLEEGCSR